MTITDESLPVNKQILNNAHAHVTKQQIQALDTAKQALLQHINYFGLTEYQCLSQYLLEKTFVIKFRTPFVQYESLADRSLRNVSELHIMQIKYINYLDVELYEFAKDLFSKRISFLIGNDIKYLSKCAIKEAMSLQLSSLNFGQV